MPKRLLILACSQRKRPDPGLLPAIERYDGPQFRVLRKFIREYPESAQQVAVYVLSAQLGVIPIYKEIPNYNRRMTPQQAIKLNQQVQDTLSDIFRAEAYASMFLSFGNTYHKALQGYERLLPASLQPIIASGSQGGRQSQLKDWLYQDVDELVVDNGVQKVLGAATIRGKKIEMNQTQVLEIARQAFLSDRASGFDNYQTWYVQIDNQKVSPKWLVSQLTGLPVSKFHSGEARRVLEQLGVEVKSLTFRGDS